MAIVLYPQCYYRLSNHNFPRIQLNIMSIIKNITNSIAVLQMLLCRFNSHFSTTPTFQIMFNMSGMTSSHLRFSCILLFLVSIYRCRSSSVLDGGERFVFFFQYVNILCYTLHETNHWYIFFNWFSFTFYLLYSISPGKEISLDESGDILIARRQVCKTHYLI